MESPLGLATVNWDPEPLAVPRRTESADKSDALQTLRVVRRRPAAAKRLECVRLQRRFPKASCDSMLGQDHGLGQSSAASTIPACVRRTNLLPEAEVMLECR